MKKIFAALSFVVLLPLTLVAAEGKWTPQQVLEIDPAHLRSLGLELAPERLWDPSRGTGLLAGAVSISGCSAGFVSSTGLIVTNHHCIFSMLQEHATTDNDIITNGFLARSQGEELPGKAVRVTVPRSFTDVTARVMSAVPKKATDYERARAIEKAERAIVAECEKKPAARCKVASFDGGLFYTLMESTELSDIRLVYAPPRAVGEYGGETDNWMWPRHAGDFAVVRAWTAPDGTPRGLHAENVPYRPDFFFPIARKGVSQGDFVMVLGYPGTTYRALTASEMAERRELWFPRREEVFGEWIAVMEKASKDDPEAAIAVAAHLKTLLNRYKNAQGQIAGFERGRILEKQREHDRAVLAWAKENPAYAPALAAYEGLEKMVEEKRASWERDFLLSSISSGPKALYLATTIGRAAIERQKPDVERKSEFTERNLERTRERLERQQKSYSEKADRQMLAAFVRRALALPKGERIAAIDAIFEGKDVDQRIASLYEETRLLDAGVRAQMFEEGEKELRARRDPLVDLGLALAQAEADLDRRETAWKGTVSRLRPEWRKAVIAHAGEPVAPDANSTLRVSFAHVKGYRPRDGVFYEPQTTLSGVVEKHTGEEPFDAPDAVLEAAREKRFGAWADAKLNDVPIDFLSDADTTGGNSGSPTINARGELVGVNFDRVWENVANDFGYNPDIARNVNADIRYMLWLLDQVVDADALLIELGLREER